MRGSGSGKGSGGSGAPAGDQPPRDPPEGGGDWGLFMIGTAVVAVLILGGGLAVGLAKKRKGQSNPSKPRERGYSGHGRRIGARAARKAIKKWRGILSALTSPAEARKHIQAEAVRIVGEKLAESEAAWAEDLLESPTGLRSFYQGATQGINQEVDSFVLGEFGRWSRERKKRTGKGGAHAFSSKLQRHRKALRG